ESAYQDDQEACKERAEGGGSNSAGARDGTCCRAHPKGDDNEGHFESFEEDRLVRQQKSEEIEARRRGIDRPTSPEFRLVLLVNGLFIVARFQTAIAEDGILQPLQSKEEQESADDQAKHIDRNPLDKRDPQRRHQQGEGRRGS